MAAAGVAKSEVKFDLSTVAGIEAARAELDKLSKEVDDLRRKPSHGARGEYTAAYYKHLEKSKAWTELHEQLYPPTGERRADYDFSHEPSYIPGKCGPIVGGYLTTVEKIAADAAAASAAEYKPAL